LLNFPINDHHKNAKYYALPQVLLKSKIFEAITKVFNEGTADQQQNALLELRDNREIILLPKHLDMIISVLKNTSHMSLGGWGTALQILAKNIKNGIIPTKLEKLQQVLRNCHQTLDNTIPENVRAALERALISVMGLLQDDYVIKILLHSTNNLNKLNKIKEYYQGWDVAQVIINNEYLLVEKQLILEKELTKVLLEIRNKAKDNQHTWQSNSLTLQKALDKRRKEEMK